MISCRGITTSLQRWFNDSQQHVWQRRRLLYYFSYLQVWSLSFLSSVFFFFFLISYSRDCSESGETWFVITLGSRWCKRKQSGASMSRNKWARMALQRKRETKSSKDKKEIQSLEWERKKLGGLRCNGKNKTSYARGGVAEHEVNSAHW